jgi:hypothetical protein
MRRTDPSLSEVTRYSRYKSILTTQLRTLLQDPEAVSSNVRDGVPDL